MSKTQSLEGYHGEILHRLENVGAEIGSILRITTATGETFEGALFPRSQYSDHNHIVLKMKNGYNVGIHYERAAKIEVVGEGPRPHFQSAPPTHTNLNLPRVAIISTGGTIASRVDYRTGAVQPALTAADLANVVPELGSIAQIEADVLFSEFSENLTPEHWKLIIQEAVRQLKKGVDGIVITQGTDTMHYTSAAISYGIQNLPVPILLVGAQRSSDRPSTDAATNLTGAIAISSRANIASVGVVMHENLSDHYIVAHRGTRVRKCHTSTRGAFKSINAPYLAKYDTRTGQVETIDSSTSKRDNSRTPLVNGFFSPDATLLKFYPGFNSKTIDAAISHGSKGLIIEGTGLGHVSQNCNESIRHALKQEIPVFMTSQTIWGRVDMNVYYTGRDLLALGVTPLEDMLPETALVKLMWVLAQTQSLEKIRSMMVQPIAGDITERTGIEEEKPIVN